MGKNKTTILIATALIIAVVGGLLYALPQKSIAAEVDRNLVDMMKTIDQSSSASMMSSNPYDYIKDNPSFDAIVALGVDALPVLEQGLRATEESGLREYIMCVAIERIAGCDLKQFGDSAWDRAEVFKAKWNDYLKGMPARVKQIMESGHDLQALADQIAKLGAPAVPYVVQYAGSIDKGNDRAMAQALGRSLAESEAGATVGEFAGKNAGLVEKLKTYVENR
jgi:hypothetical protein